MERYARRRCAGRFLYSDGFAQGSAAKAYAYRGAVVGTRRAASVIVTHENVCPRFLPAEFGLRLPEET